MEPGEYLTVAEAAARLKVHQETVRRWLKAGRLRGTLLSGKAGWRIPAREVARVLAGEPIADGRRGGAGEEGAR